MENRTDRPRSTSSRQSLRRYPSSSQSINSNVFDDSHAIETFPVADVFGPVDGGAAPLRPRPGTPPRMSARRSMTPRSNENVTQQQQYQAEEALKRRSGIYQGGTQATASRNSFSLRNDAPATMLQRNGSTGSRPEMSQRPTSIVSNFSIPRAQSPYVGPSGPSHPYGMYPQDATSLNRSSTTSTVRPPTERPYSGLNQPTHPYTLYSQATGPEMAQDPLAASTDITTVGFPGLSRGLTRRIAPGEGADDLVGADGYTEQLPPYTRYPDLPPTKENCASSQAPSLGSSGRTIVAADGQDQSTEALVAADANRDATEDENSDDEHSDDETRAHADSSRAALAKAKWAKKSKRRFWKGRIPAWVLWVGVFLLVVAAATIGGVIGRLFPHGPPKNYPDNDSDPDPESSANYTAATTTTIVDAIPLTATPTNLPVLPTGHYGFEIGYPLESWNECLTDQTQSVAWGCPDDGFMFWNVTPADIGSTQISLTYSQSEGVIYYGPQPPNMPNAVPLQLMEDTEQKDLGPAYFFQSQYTKMVILQADALVSPYNKRSLSERIKEAVKSPALHRRDTPVMPGDTPWVCYWNNTIIEGFIYLLQTELPTSLAPTSPATSYIDFGGTATAVPSAPAAVTSGAAAATTTAPGYSIGRRAPPETSYEDDNSDDDDYGPPPAPQYPMALKVEERRFPNNPVRPFCMQMEVTPRFRFVPYCDEYGNTPKVVLEECDPITQQRVALGSVFKNKVIDKRKTRLEKRDDDACICQWMIS